MLHTNPTPCSGQRASIYFDTDSLHVEEDRTRSGVLEVFPPKARERAREQATE